MLGILDKTSKDEIVINYLLLSYFTSLSHTRKKILTSDTILSDVRKYKKVSNQTKENKKVKKKKNYFNASPIRITL